MFGMILGQTYGRTQSSIFWDFSPNSLASVPVLQSLPGAVPAPEPRPLGQYQLQLGRGAASDQGPDQGQGVLVKICLKTKSTVNQRVRSQDIVTSRYLGIFRK